MSPFFLISCSYPPTPPPPPPLLSFRFSLKIFLFLCIYFCQFPFYRVLCSTWKLRQCIALFFCPLYVSFSSPDPVSLFLRSPFMDPRSSSLVLHVSRGGASTKGAWQPIWFANRFFLAPHPILNFKARRKTKTTTDPKHNRISAVDNPKFESSAVNIATNLSNHSVPQPNSGDFLFVPKFFKHDD